MSVEPDQSSGGQPADSEGRRFSTLIGSMPAAPPADRAAQDDPADPADQADGQQAATAKPTFTARASGAPDAVVPDPAEPAGPGGFGGPDNSGSSGNRVRRASVPAPAREPATPPPAPLPPAPPALPDDEGTRALPRPAAVTDEPLLSDAAGLRARWQRVQASFVDDPQEAVGDAADLIEQTAQALVGALRQRQRQLRMMWERGPEDASADGEQAASAAAPGHSDTEHLRLMMQRYRALFNQLCRP